MNVPSFISHELRKSFQLSNRVSIFFTFICTLFLLSVILLISTVMLWIPRYTYSHDTPSIFTCNLSLVFNSILLSTMMMDSWLAIIFWMLSGLILVLQSLVKCDIFCCFCLDYPHEPQSVLLIQEEESANPTMIPNVCMTAPPKGSSIVNRVQTRR